MTKEFGLAAMALVVAMLATPAMADNDDYGGRGYRAGWYGDDGGWGRGWNGYGGYGGGGGYRRGWDGGGNGWGSGWNGYGGGRGYRRDDD